MNKKVIITALGGPEVLEVVNEPISDPANTQIRIKVDYAGVAFAETLMRTISGFGIPKLPFSPGSDIVGTVDKVGSAVSSFKQDDRVGVLLMPQLGGYAKYVCVESKQIVALPKEIDAVKAVAATMNYITAWQMLEKANVTKYSKLLVHGGGGGVGSALLDLSRFKKIKTYATGSTIKQAVIKQLNAFAIDYTTDDFVNKMKLIEPSGVDAVFDSVAGSNLIKSYKVLSKRGKLISYGFSADYDKGILKMMSGFMKVLGLNLIPDGKKVFVHQLRKNDTHTIEQQKYLYQLLSEGKIDPIIHDVVPLDKAKEANQLLEEGKVIGKLVLDCR